MGDEWNGLGGSSMGPGYCIQGRDKTGELDDGSSEVQFHK